MYHYTIIQWLFYFYLYSFMGWCFESAYVSLMERKLTNRGFMRGPFLPIYGGGATMMMVVSMPVQDSIVLTYLAGCLGATVLEYVTSVVMEALFKIKYWDYSGKMFNFQGRICLSSTLMWGFFTVLTTNFLQVSVEMLVSPIPNKTLTVVTLVLTAGIGADFALSFKAAVDLGNVLVKMEHVKGRMLRIYGRLDGMMTAMGEGVENRKDAITHGMSAAKNSIVDTVSTAVAGIAGGMSTAKNGITQSMSELKGGIESRLEHIKNMVKSRPEDEYLESIRDEVSELSTEYAVNVEEHRHLSGLSDFFQRSLIRSNPKMTSEKYKDSLEELKSEAARKREYASEKKEI